MATDPRTELSRAIVDLQSRTDDLPCPARVKGAQELVALGRKPRFAGVGARVCTEDQLLDALKAYDSVGYAPLIRDRAAALLAKGDIEGECYYCIALAHENALDALGERAASRVGYLRMWAKSSAPHQLSELWCRYKRALIAWDLSDGYLADGDADGVLRWHDCLAREIAATRRVLKRYREDFASGIDHSLKHLELDLEARRALALGDLDAAARHAGTGDADVDRCLLVAEYAVGAGRTDVAAPLATRALGLAEPLVRARDTLRARTVLLRCAEAAADAAAIARARDAAEAAQAALPAIDASALAAATPVRVLRGPAFTACLAGELVEKLVVDVNFNLFDSDEARFARELAFAIERTALHEVDGHAFLPDAERELRVRVAPGFVKDPALGFGALVESAQQSACERGVTLVVVELI